MKIVFVVHDFLRGTGHGRYCIELARCFAPQHEIHVLANRFEPALDFPIRQHFIQAWRATALTAVLTFPTAAQKIIDCEKFDIVHAQGFACHRADVITAHVCNAARYKQTPPATLLKRIFPALVIPRERAFYRRSQGAEVIAISKVIQQELQREYGVASQVVHHGINTAEFNPAAKPAENIWLFAGEAVKGLAPAIRTLAKFPRARLRVVTRSDPAPYRALAASLNIGDRIVFAGPSNNMQREYQAAALFLYPSDYDAFGLVVAEAMASGLPVLIGKNIGAAEWITDGHNGFLCDPRDLNSMAAQITRLENLTKDELDRIRQQARQTALEHTWRDCAEKTGEVYQRAISSRRQRK